MTPTMSRTASSLRATTRLRETAQRVDGRPLRLGTPRRDGGADVAVVASHAAAVGLCLLDEDPSSPTGFAERRYALHRGRHGVWQGHVPDVAAGQRYGLRVHGRWDPDAGLRHNAAKLLLEPYARGVAGDCRLVPEVSGHEVDAALAPLQGGARSELHSAGHV